MIIEGNCIRLISECTLCLSNHGNKEKEKSAHMFGRPNTPRGFHTVLQREPRQLLSLTETIVQKNYYFTETHSFRNCMLCSVGLFPGKAMRAAFLQLTERLLPQRYQEGLSVYVCIRVPPGTHKLAPELGLSVLQNPLVYGVLSKPTQNSAVSTGASQMGNRV